MPNNKVVYFGETLIDISDSTITPETLPKGQIAYNAKGERIVGEMIVFPAGTVTMWAGSVEEPDGWAYCDGRSLNIADYPELYQRIGGQFGQTSTTFKIPDLRGRSVVGINQSDPDFGSVGKTGGEKKHTLAENEMPSHSHDMHGNSGTYASSGSTVWQINQAFKGYANGSKVSLYKNAFGTESAGSGVAHNNMPPYFVLNYIIKLYD